MKSFKKFVLLLSFLLGKLAADPLVQTQLSFTPGSSGSWNADWDGADGRTYFFQWSLDLEHWNYAPFMDFGSGTKSQSLYSSTDKYFVRLFMTEGDGVTSLTEAENADFDADELSNLSEVHDYSTDPMQWDSDGDGMADGWEVSNRLDPNDDGSIDPKNGANGDPDGDGLINIYEYWYSADPYNADTDGDDIPDGNEVTGGSSPTNPDTDGDDIPDKFEITVKLRTSLSSLYKYGLGGYQTTDPRKRYLKQVESGTKMSGGNPESGPNGVGPGTLTRVYDPQMGSYTSQSTGVGGSYASTAKSPTTRYDNVTISSYDDPPNEVDDDPGTVTADSTLSDENTTAMLKANANRELPEYPASFDNYGYAEADISTDESFYTIKKMKYKLVFGGAIQASLKWVEMFSPENDPNTPQDESEDPTFTAKSWSGTGAETSEFEINPYTIDPAKDGRYDIIYVEHVNVDYVDPNSHKIPSKQYANNILGKEHIVCVKDTGDIVLRAILNNSIPDIAKNKVTWTCSGGSVTSPAYGADPDSKLTAKLSSATPGKYPVTMSLDGNVMWEGVVWVIWANIAPTQHQMVLTATSGGINLSCPINFIHTIVPASVITDTDHPNLEGSLPAGVTAPDGYNSCNQSVAGGANRKWDSSRQIKGKYTSPPNITVACTDNLNLQYSNSNIVGTDDVGQIDERNEPYLENATLSGEDIPGRTWRNNVGTDGNTAQHNIQFREFTRVLLGNTWYRCSDWCPWRIELKFKKTAGIWEDNGSSQALGNINF